MPASKSSTNHIHLKTSGDHFFLLKKNPLEQILFGDQKGGGRDAAFGQFPPLLPRAAARKLPLVLIPWTGLPDVARPIPSSPRGTSRIPWLHNTFLSDQSSISKRNKRISSTQHPTATKLVVP
jgi:hypothetical protein